MPFSNILCIANENVNFIVRHNGLIRTNGTIDIVRQKKQKNAPVVERSSLRGVARRFETSGLSCALTRFSAKSFSRCLAPLPAKLDSRLCTWLPIPANWATNSRKQLTSALCRKFFCFAERSKNGIIRKCLMKEFSKKYFKN